MAEEVAAAVQHLGAFAGGGALDQQAYAASRGPVLQLSQDALRPREVASVAPAAGDGEAEVGLDRAGGLVQVVAVERQARLEPQAVAGAEPGGADPLVGQQAAPQALGGVRGDQDLEPVLAGVARARDQQRRPLQLHSGETHESKRRRLRQECIQHRRGVGPLQRNQAPVVEPPQLGLPPGRVGDEGEVGLLGPGVDDDEELALAPRLGRPAEPGRQGELFVVVNAGTKETDFSLIANAAGGKAELRRLDDGGLIALQGPDAAAVLDALLPEAPALGFMRFARMELEGAPLLVSRSGYTGEDGFEILVPADAAERLWSRLLSDERVRPAGLGARDSLRLEAGLPLYGHDLDETTSPIEADLGFAVSRRRRDARDFPGAERILRELEHGPPRRRVGLLVEGAPAREGAEVLDSRGDLLGHVTSGGFSPTLKRPIAMAYVDPGRARPGAAVQVMVRGRAQPAAVTPLPFVPHRYARKP